MIPAVYNVTLYQGVDFSRSFTFPFDLSSYPTAQLEIRSRRTGALLIALDLGHGLAIAGSVITWSLTAAETVDLPVQTDAVYDLRFTDAEGQESVYFGGRIQVTPRVTIGGVS